MARKRSTSSWRRAIGARFPAAAAVMIGRGLVSDPALVSRVRGEAVEPDALRQFHEALCDAYCEAFGGPGSAIHRMKAIWALMLPSFQGGEAYAKRLGKARRWEEFRALTDQVLTTLPPAAGLGPSRFETEL